jgi:uncharacterized membrane protein
VTEPEHKLIVIGFDEPLKANEFLLAALRLQRHEQIRLHDAVFVERDPSGRTSVRETQDLTPGRGALGGAIWGLLIGTLLGGPIGGLIGGAASAGGGALLGKLIDTGIKDEQIKAVRKAVPAGTTALALLISHLSLGDLQRELARFPGATLVESDLSEAAVIAVRIALGEQEDPGATRAS